MLFAPSVSFVHATVRGTDPPGNTFLVEHYWPGVTSDEFSSAAERVRSSAEQLAAEGERIRYLHSTLVPEDEAGYCVLEADSRALVEKAYAQAGVHFERVVESIAVHAQTSEGGHHA